MRPRHASMAKQEEQEVNKVKPTEMATLSFSLPLSVSSHTVGLNVCTRLSLFLFKTLYLSLNAHSFTSLLCSPELSLSELGIPLALGEMEGERVEKQGTAAALERQ